MSKEKFEQTLDWQLNEIARKIELLNKGNDKGFRFAPLLYYERNKSSGGLRKIYLPRIKDQLVYKWMHNELIEKALSEGVNLTTKSPHEVVLQFRSALKQYDKPVIVRTDIKSFFDSVPRERVIDLACQFNINSSVRNLMRIWSKKIIGRPMWVAGKSKDCLVSGLPQGLSISAALAELWGNEIKRRLQKEIVIFRYVDDLAFICGNEEEALNKLELLNNCVSVLGLELSVQKTEVKPLHKGVDWLGLRHFKKEVHANEERLERWMKRFQKMRTEVMENYLKTPEKSKQEVIEDFNRLVKDELSGKTSARPQWYSIVKDKGQWKTMDVQLHAQYKMLYLQLDMPLHQPMKWPSIHKTMTGRLQA